MAAAVTAARQRAISSRQGEFNNPQGRDAGGCLAAAAVWRQWQYWGAAHWQWRLAAAATRWQRRQRGGAAVTATAWLLWGWRWQRVAMAAVAAAAAAALQCHIDGGSLAAAVAAARLLRRWQQGGSSVWQWSSAVKLIDTETGFRVGHGNVFPCPG